jgi:propionyl-CoA carboxylase alpha chain
VANRLHLERATGISGQLPGHEFEIGDAFVVVTREGSKPPVHLPMTVNLHGKRADVDVAGKLYVIELDADLRDVVIAGRCNSEPFVAQIERTGLAYRVSYNGAQIDAKVLSPRAAELSLLMPFKAPPDLSKFLLSPMPGLLVDVAAVVGQKVMAGERLAVIEAMKMENILLATQDGVVAEVAAKKGDSLSVDQVIIRFT